MFSLGVKMGIKFYGFHSCVNSSLQNLEVTPQLNFNFKGIFDLRVKMRVDFHGSHSYVKILHMNEIYENLPPILPPNPNTS